MDDVRKLILARVAELQTDLKAASLAMGRNHAYLQQFISRGVPVELKERDRKKLAAFLGVKEWALRAPLLQSVEPDLPPDFGAAEEASADSQMTIGSETGRRGVPVDASAQLDVTAGMGGGGLTIISEGVPGRSGMTFAAEFVRDFWRLPHEVLAALGLKAADVIIVPVQGDSMSETLIEGDYVFVDTRHRLPSPDGIYCLTDDFGGLVVKRLEVVSRPRDDEVMVRVISDNPRHEPKERMLSELRIIGRVLRRFGVVG